MILDAAALYAYFVRNSAQHWTVAGEIELVSSFEELVVSPFVMGELEAMVRARFGVDGWLAVLEQLGSGAWAIAVVDAEHLREMHGRVAGGETLAGASVAVLAESGGS